MTKITYIAFDGTRFDVDAQNGSTVMENAVRNAIPGIEA
ncbi:MAG: 2Fe-2S ferredoxin, partial [Rhizobiaceae bacterium]|nr:2Fe-2S ferredoxin [Rhizobiaceae bacterium]